MKSLSISRVTEKYYLQCISLNSRREKIFFKKPHPAAKIRITHHQLRMSSTRSVKCKVTWTDSVFSRN